MFGSKTVQGIRQFSKTVAKQKKSLGYSDDHAYKGPGSNLPFDVYNKYKFTLYYTLFVSSGFSLPFLMVQYIKKRSG